jgi:hypothetical protein
MSIFIVISDPKVKSEIASIFADIVQIGNTVENHSLNEQQKRITQRLKSLGFCDPPNGFYANFKTEEDGELVCLQLETSIVGDEIYHSPYMEGDRIEFYYFHTSSLLFEDHKDKFMELVRFYGSGSDGGQVYVVIDWSDQYPCDIQAYKGRGAEVKQVYSTGDDTAIDALCHELEDDAVYTKDKSDFFDILKEYGVF